MAQSEEHGLSLSSNSRPLAAESRAVRPAWLRYLAAALFVAAAAGVRVGLLSALGPHSPFVTFYPAVMLAALFGGLGPGLVATLLSVFAASFWMEPAGLSLIRHPTDWLLVAVFLLSCTILSSLCEAMRRAWAKAAKSESLARLAEELREREETFRSLFDQAAVPTAVQGPDGKILRVNQAYCQFLGYSAEELRTLTLSDISHPDDMELKTPMRRLLTGELSLYHTEKRYLHKNGSVIWGDVNVSLVRGAQGKPLYFIVQVQDITERKRAENALQWSEERFRYILKHNPNAIAVLDRDMRYLMVSDRFLHDYHLGVADVIGKSHYEIFPEIPDSWRNVHQRCLAGAIERSEEDSFVRQGGSVDYNRWECRPWYDDQGRIGGIIMYTEVITDRKRAEEALRQNRELLRAVIEGTSDAVFVKDLEGRYLLCNTAAAHFMGRRADDVIGHDDTFLFSPDEAKAVMEDDRAVMSTGKTMTYEENITDATGRPRTFHATKGPLFDAQGKLIGIFGISRDITDLKQTQEALSVRVEQLRQVVRVSDLGVFDHNQRTETIYWSPKMREICGWSAEETMGLPEYLERLHPEDREEIAAAIQRAHDPTGDGLYAIEHRLVRPDGGIRWLSVRSQTFFEGEGNRRRPVRTIGVALDITERKLAEKALLQSEAQAHALAAELAAIMEALPAITFIAREPDCRHISSNRAACELLRLPPMANTSMSVPPEERPTTFRFMKNGREIPARELPVQWAAATGESVRNYEMAIAFPDGSERIIVGDAVPLLDDLGKPRGAVAAFIDITDRKRMEENLKEADRRKNEFLAMLAHELRNPLAPVRNAVQVLRMTGPHDPVLMRQRDIIDRQVTHMARLVDDLLDVSRITRGQIELKKQNLDLVNVLAHAVEIATPIIEARRQTLSLALPADGLCVEADQDRLAQVVGNLLSNAAKYTPEQGRIWLETTREGNTAVIRVRDTGTGIAPEMLPRVFDLFAQADQGLARSQGGLGIGLTMVKTLVEMHGGTVEARSGGLGQGSEFTIRLPARPCKMREFMSTNGQEERAREGPSRRILVVDDVVDSSESLADMLRLLGHEVRTAYDGLTVLKMLCDYLPDVVLLDIGMPGMDGYEVARRLRQKECGKKMLLVALTGYAQDHDRQMSREAGFDAYLVKPLDVDALRQLLAQSVLSHP